MDFGGLVWKRVWKITFLVWKRVRIWRTGRHTPTKNSQEYLPGKISQYPILYPIRPWTTVTARSDPCPFYTAYDVISQNGQGQLCPRKTCAGWRDLSNHTRISEHDSVKESGEKDKKMACNIDPKISMKISVFHYPPVHDHLILRS